MLVLIAGGAAHAQNSDLGVLTGTTYSASSLRFGAQVNYAWQFWERPAGRLYVEVPFIVPVPPRGESFRFFLTPGIRYHFNLTQRIVLYAGAGGGIASMPGASRTSAAFSYGGGVDFRLSRRWSLRGDVRNLVTPSKILSTHDTPSVMIGVGMHF